MHYKINEKEKLLIGILKASVNIPSMRKWNSLNIGYKLTIKVLLLKAPSIFSIEYWRNMHLKKKQS